MPNVSIFLDIVLIMKLGFIGTGKIASSVIIGICNSNISFTKILISPRNRLIAKKISKKFKKVIIAKNNQEIIEFKVSAGILMLILEDKIAESRFCSIIFFMDNVIDESKFRYYELFELPTEVEHIELH